MNFNGKEIKTDDEGYLLDLNDWSYELMEYMAKADGITLTDAHIKVITTVQEYFKTYATTPPIRGLIKLLKNQGDESLANSIELAKLFPDGAAKMAARYAGLKKPIKCI
ncbi:MAG: TusE/DsrC/DsvC family sulfur relay protein [Succinivibrio sp.]